MKLKRRRITAKSKKLSRIYSHAGTQWLLCKVCLTDEVEVGADIGAVTCGRCVQRMVGGPQIKVKKLDTNGNKFPRGWHLKKIYITSDGTKYERGKLVGEPSAGTAPTKRKRGTPSRIGHSAKRGRPKKIRDK